MRSMTILDGRQWDSPRSCFRSISGLIYTCVFFAHMFAYSVLVLQRDPLLRWRQGEGLYMGWGPLSVILCESDMPFHLLVIPHINIS